MHECCLIILCGGQAEVSETWTPGKFRTGHVIVAEQLLKESLERYLAEHRGEYEATCRYIQERTTTNVEEEMQARSRALAENSPPAGHIHAAA